jgi:hypothetical protein
MVTRKMKLPESGGAAQETGDVVPETVERLSQRRRPEAGRYLLQIDRQTKGSYATAETAIAKGMTIKTGYPLVQVTVYDSVDCQTTLVEVPAASESGDPLAT